MIEEHTTAPKPPGRRRIHVPADLHLVLATAQRITADAAGYTGPVPVENIRRVLASDATSALAGREQVPTDRVLHAALRYLGADLAIPADPEHGQMVLLRSLKELDELDSRVLAAATGAQLSNPLPAVTVRDVQLRCRWRNVSAWQVRGSLARLVAATLLEPAGVQPHTVWQVASK
jgi:hypothetical protein